MKIKNAAASNSQSTNLQGINTLNNAPEDREQMIAMSAYFRAEKRGFSAGNDLADWFQSEREVDRHLSSFSS